MSEVRQCPYCELRFPSRLELEGHIASDHPDTLDRVDDDTRPRAADGEEGGAGDTGRRAPGRR